MAEFIGTPLKEDLIGDGAQIQVSSSLKAAVEGADAAVILTDGGDHRQQLAHRMVSPRWVFDSRNATNRAGATAPGLRTWGIAQGGL
jgi:UDP-N-acetyl-D-mannosaminuronate dehydrogenase